MSTVQAKLAAICGLLIIPALLLASKGGTIEGTVIDRATGDLLPYVNVMIHGSTMGAATDGKGKFTIPNVPEGEYTVSASLIGHVTKDVNHVVVKQDEKSSLTIYLDDESVRLGEMTVYGASLRQEHITEAPAAVTVLEQADLQLSGVSGQLPKLLETEPGVDIAQNGLYDFNINMRGFNSSLTRRLLVLLDGRDLSIVFLGAQEWNGLSVPVEDLGKMEVVRGPGSALYGANAFNGVINITTPSPRQILGTKVSLAGGDFNSLRGDVRYAGMDGPWSYKINVGRFQGDTWSQSRTTSLEYAGLTGLNKEVVPVNDGKIGTSYGSARVDYDVSDSSTATVEGGMSQVENEIYITGIGRIQVQRAIKPWGRMSYTDQHFNAQVWASGRNSLDPQISLATGLPLFEKSLSTQGDMQYHFTELENRLSLIGGLSYRYQTINTKGSLMLDTHNDNMSGIYGQAEYTLPFRLKADAAVRWDRSSLQPDEVSPKGALVWTPLPDQSFRITYNKAYQSPNYSELFLHVRDPITHFSYFGNDNLVSENIDGYEFGYKGIFQNSIFLTFDAYYNQLRDFITDLSQGVNPQYTTTDSVILSYGNAGKVTEAGFEVAANYYLSDEWMLSANYALFNFTIQEQNEKDPILPNAPQFKINGGITYRSRNGYDVNVNVKYVPSFDWSAGIYAGPILAYALVNVAASYQITPHLNAACNVSNLFDRVHYEIFGGSLLHRRALLSLTTTF
ncbi:MAG TPA: TonB-dependent receptor [Bacteroidota bacterium]|nr:TonB-dependent receptor [Bacteroidota bacterium]